jgi:hypothetical protein
MQFCFGSVLCIRPNVQLPKLCSDCVLMLAGEEQLSHKALCSGM